MGSFLNVVALRWNSGVTILGRSSCASCGRVLRYRDLVPILSYLFLRGRCAKCHTKLSIQYPLVEILTGVVFLSVWSLPYAYLHKSILLFVLCIYIVISIYDYRHKIIPDTLVYSASAVSLLVPLFVSQYSLLDWLAGPILFTFFASLWLITLKKAIGFGDSKLALSIGVLLGAGNGFSAIILGFWTGALYGIVLILINYLNPLLRNGKKITMKSEIPFAPFMVLGAWLSLIMNLDLLHVSLF